MKRIIFAFIIIGNAVLASNCYDDRDYDPDAHSCLDNIAYGVSGCLTCVRRMWRLVRGEYDDGPVATRVSVGKTPDNQVTVILVPDGEIIHETNVRYSYTKLLYHDKMCPSYCGWVYYNGAWYAHPDRLQVKACPDWRPEPVD
ncbi:MAG: hypothetical protein MJ025_05805 [Victivallaceae bacterium]|nr:hypothetical protein [Victivallaceae bacterium]